MDRNTTVTQVSANAPDNLLHDPLQVWEKNNDYRDGFRNMMLIANIQAALILVLVCVFAFHVETGRNNDRYFAEALKASDWK